MYASTIKMLSICLLHVIAIANKLEILCGDVGNAFVNAYMNEKVTLDHNCPRIWSLSQWQGPHHCQSTLW
jgi:hypothetical protein